MFPIVLVVDVTTHFYTCIKFDQVVTSLVSILLEPKIHYYIKRTIYYLLLIIHSNTTPWDQRVL